MHKDDHVFSKNLIQAVRRFPCIYDTDSKEHHNKQIVTDAWERIASEIDESESVCRERWRNIRSAFVRTHRIKHKKPYYLEADLQFLVPYTKMGSNKISDDQHDNEVTDEATHTYNDSDVYSTNSSSDKEELSPVSTVSSRVIEFKSVNVTTNSSESSKKSLKHSTPSISFNDWLNARNSPKHDDPDLHFFQSLVPDVRKLTDKQKRKFRRQVIDLLDKILDEPSVTGPINL